MNSNTQLRLSLHTVPELSIGRAPLTPQNSQFDPRRLHYLEVMVAYLNSLFDNLQKHHSRAEALSRLQTVLPRLLGECEVGLSSVIESLRDLGFIEEADPSAQIVPRSLAEGSEDRLTWLGHACLLFQTSRSSICVDPYLRPHIKWTEADLKS